MCYNMPDFISQTESRESLKTCPLHMVSGWFESIQISLLVQDHINHDFIPHVFLSVFLSVVRRSLGTSVATIILQK